MLGIKEKIQEVLNNKDIPEPFRNVIKRNLNDDGIPVDPGVMLKILDIVQREMNKE